MVDYKKIDAYFNQVEAKQKDKLSRRARALRFAKLALPSVAAVFIGLLLVFPTVKDNQVVSGFDVTLPKKGELEKLHMENTVFTMTDKDNAISSFTADTIDETEAGSKILKMINPKGEVPAGKGKRVYLDSLTGYYDQTANTFQAVGSVKALYDGTTTALTEEAMYDFPKAFGHGSKKVHAFGDWGKLWAEGFEYDKNKALLTLLGHSQIINAKNTLWADQEVRYYQTLQKAEAFGHVRAKDGENMLYADRMVAYFKDSAAQELEKVEAFGHVRVETPKGKASGDEGVYLPATADVELKGNVEIIQQDNVIKGERAVTNLQTGVSKVLTPSSGKRRVKGVIRGETIKGQKHE